MVKNFCDKVLFRAYYQDLEDEDLIHRFSNTNRKNIGPLRAISITYFELEESGRNYLSFLYKYFQKLGVLADYSSPFI